jgi:hypothetical protein
MHLLAFNLPIHFCLVGKCFCFLLEPQYTTGMAWCADGLTVRRRPNIGAVGIHAGQPSPWVRPSAYVHRRGMSLYADGHPRRIPGHRHSCRVEVRVGCALTETWRRHVYADGAPRHSALPFFICSRQTLPPKWRHILRLGRGAPSA